MPKVRITVEAEGKVETVEVDRAVIVRENGGQVTLQRINTGSVDTIGLLDYGREIETALIKIDK